MPSSPQLPDELLLHIFSFLPPHPLALPGGYSKLYRSLALSSRRFYRLIRPFAWRTLTLYGIKTLRPSALAICSLIVDNPELAQAVRSLTLISWDLGPDAIYLARAGQTMPDAFAVLAGQSREASRERVYAAVRAMTRLEELHIERCAFSAPFETIVGAHAALREVTLSGSSFHTHAAHPGDGASVQLEKLTINGGSEDRSYLDFCIALAASPRLRALELVKTLGSAGALLLPDLCALRYPALTSFTLRGLAPEDVEPVAGLLAAHPSIHSLTILQEIAESQLAPPIPLSTFPWTLLLPSRPPKLRTYDGPSALTPIFLPRVPIEHVTIREPFGALLLSAPLAWLVSSAIAASSTPVRTLELHVGRLEGAALLRAAFSLLPRVEDLCIYYIPPTGTRFSKSKMLAVLAPSLAKFTHLRSLELICDADEQKDVIGDLRTQCMLVRAWAVACPTLVEVRLSELVRWVSVRPRSLNENKGGEEWEPVFADDSITCLARMAGKRHYGSFIPPPPKTRDWEGRLEAFMTREGCEEEYRQWAENGEGG